MIRVCLAGATGWTGTPLSREIAKQDDIILTGAVSRSHGGEMLGNVVGEPGLNVKIAATVEEALKIPADVLVDYTNPDIVKKNVLVAISKRVHVVIGTSGLTDSDFVEIDEAAREKGVGVIAAGNFSITAVLLERFACEAAQHLSSWEIFDFASAAKVDAPSGITREIAHRLGEIKRPDTMIPVEETVGPKESRGAEFSGSRIHSIRLPGYTIGVEIIFGESHERLTIRHDADDDASPYLQGTLLAIRKAGHTVGLVRGLDRVMEWSKN
jgi:4-hydroxy-tetrahydrodipicolinate reductase